MIKRKKNILIILIALAVALMTAGFSFWIIIANPQSISAIKYSENSANLPDVAYIVRGGTKHSTYKTVEQALISAQSGDIVHVIPGQNPTINSNCTVKSGVSLTLHFEDLESENAQYDGTYGSSSGGHRNADYRNKTREGRDYDANDVGKNASAKYNYWTQDDCYKYCADRSKHAHVAIKDSDGTITGYADKCTHFNNFADTKAGNLQNQLTIAKNVTLTVNGTLNIGGFIGNAGQGLGAYTSGYYSQIVMGKNAQIISNGTIDCLGYVKEEKKNNGSRVIAKTGNVYAPFVIYTYRGGQITAGTFTNSSKVSVMPFTVYDMPNIQSVLEVQGNAKLIGYTSLYTPYFYRTALGIDVEVEPRHNLAEVNVIGDSESIINIDENSRVEIKYNDVDGVTSKDGTTTLDLYGNCKNGILAMEAYIGIDINAYIMKIVIDTVPINTKDVYFAIPWKFDITLKSGNFDVKHMMKLLPGATLTVGDEATLNVGNELIIYDSFVDNTRVYPYPTDAEILALKGKTPAQLIVNGTVNVGSALGGYVTAGKANAMIKVNVPNINDGDEISVSSPEGWGTMKGISELIGVVGDIRDGKYGSAFTYTANPNYTNGLVTKTMTGKLYENNTPPADKAFTNKLYVSAGNASGYFWQEGTGYSQVTLKYDANDGDLTGDEEGKYWIKDGATNNIEFVATPNPVREHYEFVGWYCEDGTTPAIGSLLTDGKTVYAKWVEKEYDLKLVITEKDGSIRTENGGMVKLSTLPYTIAPFDSDDANFEFDGWYTTSAFATAIQNNVITTSNLSQIISGDNVFVYGRFIKAPVTITLKNGNTQVGDVIKIPSGETFDISSLAEEESIKALSANNDNVNVSTYFTGKWYTDSACTNEFTSGKVEGNITLYAGFANKYKLTVQNKKGSGGLTNQDSRKGLPQFTLRVYNESGKEIMNHLVISTETTTGAIWLKPTDKYMIEGSTTPSKNGIKSVSVGLINEQCSITADTNVIVTGFYNSGWFSESWS
ncbi:MAG: InlB B-repeat-containing protein [Clostridia bacterium]|nr:InlB B-repeat-containing protein [Clostridia bacterium]